MDEGIGASPRSLYLIKCKSVSSFRAISSFIFLQTMQQQTGQASVIRVVPTCFQFMREFSLTLQIEFEVLFLIGMTTVPFLLEIMMGL
jgi:hypothetical protein